MNNKQLQEYLSKFPGEMPIKLRIDRHIIDLTNENILHTADTAYVNNEAPKDEWDAEDGKIELGKGKQYLLFNPIIY